MATGSRVRERNLGGVLATVGGVTGGGYLVVIFALMSENWSKYAITGLVVILACISYLWLQRRGSCSDAIRRFSLYPASPTTFRILLLLFLAVFLLSILAVLARPGTYSRPASYFYLTSALVGILLLETLLLPTRKAYSWIILTQTIIICWSFRFSIQILFPDSFIWYDSWYHARISEEIAETGHIPGTFIYSKLPVFHLLFGSESTVIGNDDFVLLSSLNSLLKSALTVAVIYCIGSRVLSSERIGLLSALFYTFLDRAILLDATFTPTSLAVIWVVFVVYLILRPGFIENWWMALPVLTFMLVVILTHTVTAFLLAILLVVLLVALRRGLGRRQIDWHIRVTGQIVTMFSVSMFGFWVFASGYLSDFLRVIYWAFDIDKLTSASSATNASYLAGVPVTEYLFSYSGLHVSCFLAVVGFLYAISCGKARCGAVVLCGMTLLAISFLSMGFGLYFASDRWWYYSQHFLTYSIALGFLLVCSVLTSRRERRTALTVVAFLIVFMIAFMNVTGPVSNFDSPAYSPHLMVRHACTESEVVSIQYLSAVYSGEILTDVQAAVPAAYQGDFDTARIHTMDPQILESNDYVTFWGLVVFRDYVTDGHPFDAKGMYSMSSTPFPEFEKANSNRIFDSGSETAFLNYP